MRWLGSRTAWGIAGVVCLVVLAGCTHTPRDATTLDDARGADHLRISPTTMPDLEALDRIILQGIADRLYPGAVCVVGRVDRETDEHDILYAQSFGYTAYAPADVDGDGYHPVLLHTLYDLASVTKLVGTTSAALIVLDDGGLELDAPVARTLPGFAQHGKAGVTIRQLMTHTSGLPAYENPENVERNRPVGVSPSDALAAHYAGLRPLAPPGERYTYSCLNFQTLARLVEDAGGRPLESLLRERLFGPLGMRDTTWCPVVGRSGGIAPTHRDASGLAVAGVVHDPLARYHGSDPRCPGNAGLYGTAPDLARWCAMVLRHGRHNNQQLLDADLLAQATAIQTDPAVVGEARGLGFDVYESEHYVSAHNATPGHYLVGHSGYTGTLVLIDQHTGVYMVLLTNRTFPADTGAADQAPSIHAVRRACWQVVRGFAAADDSTP